MMVGGRTSNAAVDVKHFWVTLETTSGQQNLQLKNGKKGWSPFVSVTQLALIGFRHCGTGVETLFQLICVRGDRWVVFCGTY